MLSSPHFGRAPDFVDGHQHVHILPGVRLWLFDALESRGLKGNIWLRDSGDRLSAVLARRIEVKKALAVNWLARGFAALAKSRGFQINQGFAGYSGFNAKRDYATDFRRLSCCTWWQPSHHVPSGLCRRGTRKPRPGHLLARQRARVPIVVKVRGLS